MDVESEGLPWLASEGQILREDSAEEGNVRIFDLEERTARFGESVIEFCKAVPMGPRTNRLIDQLTGSGTSVGANYCEADDAVSKKEFAHLIGISRKEAREAMFFIRMIAKACPELRSQARLLWCEANELHLIFAKVRRTTLQNIANQP